jgi:hypothetical protein
MQYLCLPQAQVNQSPPHQDIFCIKIQTFFNGFLHYSPYIDYSSINCVPQLAKKGGGGV